MMTDITSCPHCRTAMLPGQRQCLVCGGQVDEPSRNCPACGRPNPASARFCTQCGSSLETVASAQPVQEMPVGPEPFVAVRNPGAKTWISIGLALFVLLGLVGVHTAISKVFFTPERAVTGFFDALSDRDAAAALSYLGPSETEGQGLLLRSEVLKHDGYVPPADVAIGEVTDDGVDVTFTLAGKQHSMTLVVQPAPKKTLGVFRSWVVTQGGVRSIEITAPGGVQAMVNGVPVPAESRFVAAFPGQYQVGIEDNPLLEAPQVPVVVAEGRGLARLVPKLKESVRSEVETQVKSYLDGCAKQDSLAPTGCPFNAYSGSTVTNVKWTITTYPTLQLNVNQESGTVAVSYTRSGRAEVTGTYPDGTAYQSTDTFGVNGRASVVDGKVRFDPRT